MWTTVPSWKESSVCVACARALTASNNTILPGKMEMKKKKDPQTSVLCRNKMQKQLPKLQLILKDSFTCTVIYFQDSVSGVLYHLPPHLSVGCSSCSHTISQHCEVGSDLCLSMQQWCHLALSMSLMSWSFRPPLDGNTHKGQDSAFFGCCPAIPGTMLITQMIITGQLN